MALVLDVLLGAHDSLSIGFWPKVRHALRPRPLFIRKRLVWLGKEYVVAHRRQKYVVNYAL